MNTKEKADLKMAAILVVVSAVLLAVAGIVSSRLGVL